MRSILGNDWAMFYVLLGGREAGKSYAVTQFYCNQFKKYGRPFYWLRLTEASKNKLLQNNAEKLVDPDIRRNLHLDLETSGDNVYNVKRDKKGKVIEKTLMCRVLALSTFYSDKGSGLFDKDFLNDPNNLEFLNYTYASGQGDPLYPYNVMQYIINPDEPLSIHYLDEYENDYVINYYVSFQENNLTNNK